MWNSNYASTGPYAHLASSWRRDLPLYTVFVDHQRRGVVRGADLDSLAPGCTHVDQLPYAPDEPNVEIRIVNAHCAWPLFDEEGQQSGNHPTNWMLHIDPVDMGYDNPDLTWENSDQFEVVAARGYASNRHWLAKWDQTGGNERSATLTLPPGAYHVALEEENSGRKYIQTAPLVVREGVSTAQLQFDIAEAEQRVVVARTPDGQVPGYHAARGVLIGAGSFYIGESLSFHSRMQHVKTPKDERVAVFWGWGAPPGLARLTGAPGANGRAVPIRPVLPSDHTPFADFLVEVPNPRRMRTTVRPRFGGQLSASTDASIEALEPLGLIRSTPPPPSRTASHDGKETLTVFLAGESARGVLTETTREGRWTLVDWFEATQEGISFLGQDEEASGRSVQITNTSEEYRQVRVRAAGPHAAKYPEPVAALLAPGAVQEIWLPPTAGEVSWFKLDSKGTTVRPAIGRAHKAKDGALVIE